MIYTKIETVPRTFLNLALFFSMEKTALSLLSALAELEEEVKALCKLCRLPDLSDFRYTSIALCEVEIRRKGKTYRRVQLKGYLVEGGKQKTTTISSWKPEEVPADVHLLVRLYRAGRHLLRALDYLSSPVYTFE